MNFSSFFFFLVIIFIGLRTTISDLKVFKIWNKDIILGFALGLGLFILKFIFSYFGLFDMNFSLTFFLDTLLNFWITILVSVGFWLMKFWSSADSKLFILFSFLLPISVYELGSVEYFPAFIILSNTFLILIFFMIFQILFRGKFEHYKKAFLRSATIKNFNWNILGIFILFHWFLSSVATLFTPGEFVLFAGFMFFFAGGFFNKFFTKHYYILYLLVCLRPIIDTSVFTLNFVYEFSFIIGVYFCLMFFRMIPDLIFSKKLSQKEISKGMILKYPIVKLKSKVFELNGKNLAANVSKDGSETKFDILVPSTTRGLNSSEFKELNKLFKDKKLLGKVEVLEHTCFAPYLFLGVLVTFICSGNVLTFLVKLIN